MKRTVAALVAGLLLGGTAAGLASTRGRTVVVRPGNNIKFSGLDLWCSYSATDPDHLDPGPSMYCERQSSIPHGSRSFAVSRYHLSVTNQGGAVIVYRVTRSP